MKVLIVLANVYVVSCLSEWLEAKPVTSFHMDYLYVSFNFLISDILANRSKYRSKDQKNL